MKKGELAIYSIGWIQQKLASNVVEFEKSWQKCRRKMVFNDSKRHSQMLKNSPILLTSFLSALASFLRIWGSSVIFTQFASKHLPRQHLLLAEYRSRREFVF